MGEAAAGQGLRHSIAEKTSTYGAFWGSVLAAKKTHQQSFFKRQQ
jgi:hypothetical protein